MPSTFWGLGIGTSGLYVNQAGLNTTAHNISNAQTEGYSRQTANQSASTPISTHNTSGMAGTGVVITSVTQERSEYFDSKYRENSAIAGEYNSKSQYMTEIQNYLNDLEGTGFSTTFDKFYDRLQSLSTNPFDSTYRNDVIGFAKTFTEYFNSVSESLQASQTSLNFEVENQVKKVNTLAQQIATLSQQINRVEINGQNANDIRDKRNALVDDLSQIANVKVLETKSENSTGLSTYKVFIDGNMLVDTSEYKTLKVVPRSDEEKINQNDVDGLYDIKWDNGNDFNIKSATLTGTLKSLIDVRDGNNNENLKGTVSAVDNTTSPATLSIKSTNIDDVTKLNIPQSGTITVGNQELVYKSFSIKKGIDGKYTYTFDLKDTPSTADAAAMVGQSTKVGESIDYKGIPYYMSKMNECVRTYASAFNAIHKKQEVVGGTLKVTAQDANGDPALDFFNGTDKVTGNNYNLSTDINTDGIGASYYNITAANFTVTKKILDDPKKIATTTNISKGVESKELVDEMLKLKNSKSVFHGASATEFIHSFIADIGVDTNTANNFSKSQTNILNTVKNQRLSVSGVDSDEEAMKLIKYQQGFNLNSKVISVMNEVLDKLINGTGV
ncbi:flagellar hook-associated protein FlgK [Anaeromicropila herbilytica]|uniref:Flagellar hook-associated protein 1 n=1 Tax=Anaeromicropila herbilytica TaxID=2785025 RepID=A0A7R7EP92_9FIRM|nr:flagellar hook-associated protein FlgK [Anaeromicropila herbilytica]BCN32560.1 hypothetical protein bsdtb5_38550 [Anaeromicropila herbilytica]